MVNSGFERSFLLSCSVFVLYIDILPLLNECDQNDGKSHTKHRLFILCVQTRLLLQLRLDWECLTSQRDPTVCWRSGSTGLSPQSWTSRSITTRSTGAGRSRPGGRGGRPATGWEPLKDGDSSCKLLKSHSRPFITFCVWGGTRSCIYTSSQTSFSQRLWTWLTLYCHWNQDEYNIFTKWFE